MERTSSQPAPENNTSLPRIKPISPPSRRIILQSGITPPGNGSERSSFCFSGFLCTNSCSGCSKRRRIWIPRAMRRRGCVSW